MIEYMWENGNAFLEIKGSCTISSFCFRFPTPGHGPESHVRQNFNQQQQQQQQPRFQQMGQGFQNQPRPQRFQSQGERMPHNLNNNAVPQQSVMK